MNLSTNQLMFLCTSTGKKPKNVFTASLLPSNVQFKVPTSSSVSLPPFLSYFIIQGCMMHPQKMHLDNIPFIDLDKTKMNQQLTSKIMIRFPKYDFRIIALKSEIICQSFHRQHKICDMENSQKK